MDSRSWQSMESLEPRLMLSGTLADISELFIEQGIHSNADGGPVSHEFEIGFELEQTGLVESARFRLADQIDVWTNLQLDDSDEDEEWYWDTSSTNAADLAQWADQEFVFEIIFVGDATPHTTSLSFEHPTTGEPLVQPTQQPEFASVFAYQTGVGTDTLLAWEPVTDGNINWLEAELHSVTPATQQGNNKTFEPDDVNATSADTFILAGETFYSLELQFENGHEGTNADNVPCFVSKFTNTEITFDTFTDRLSQIDEVYIERGLIEGTPDQNPAYEFEFGFISPDSNWFTAAELTTPSGTHTNIDQSGQTDDGGYEFWRNFIGDENEPADYGFGTYILTLDLTSGDRVATSFVFADPDTGDDLPLPVAPVLNNPAHGATGVATDVTFAWDAVVDPAVTEIDLELQDANTGDHLHEWEFGPDATVGAQTELLAGQDYVAELLVASEIDDLTNDVSIPYSIQTFRSVSSEFTTRVDPQFDPWANVQNVYMDRGQFSPPGGGTVEAFEFGIEFDSVPQWLTAAAFEYDGQWYDLASEHVGDTDWEAELSDAAATVFGPGVYTLRLTDDGAQTYTTTFTFADTFDAPTQMPVFVAPINDAEEVVPNVMFKWDAVADENVMAILLEVEEVDSGVSAIDFDLDSSFVQINQEKLQGLTHYEAELAFVNGEELTNDDNINFTAAYFTASAIEFTTALAESPLDNIGSVQLESDIVQMADGSTQYTFTFGFGTMEEDWCQSARFQVDGDGPWYDLQFYENRTTGRDSYLYTFVADTEAGLNPYLADNYTVEVTVTDGSVHTTEMVFPSALTWPEPMPQITSPLNGASDVGIGPTIEWDSILGFEDSCDGFNLEIFELGSVEPAVSDWFNSDQTSYTLPESLKPDTTYVARLRVLDQHVWRDVIHHSCFTDFGKIHEIEFTTGDIGNPLDYISHVMIDRTESFDGDDVSYEFKFGFETDLENWFELAEFQSPDGQWRSLNRGRDDEWEFKAVTEDPVQADAFAPGVYTLRLTLSDDSTVSTEFTLADDLVSPAGPPVFTVPLDGAENMRPDLTFAWGLPGGPQLNALSLEMYDADSGQFIDELSLGVQATEAPQTILQPGGNYKAELEALIGVTDSNDDGVSYATSMIAERVVRFSTADSTDLTTLIGGIYLEEGDSTYGADDTPYYEFEFGFGAYQLDTILDARMQAPSGEWYPMTLDSFTEGDWVYEWEFDTDDLDVTEADFGSGTYVLELTLWDDSVVTTDFLFDAAITQPTAVPEWTAPLANSQVGSNVAFAWTPVAGATGQWLEVEDRSEAEVIDKDFDAVTSSYDQSVLLAGQTYTAEIGAYNLVSSDNADGLAYTAERYFSNEIEFDTFTGTDVLAKIDNVIIRRGAFQYGPEYDMQAFEFTLQSSETDWFTLAELQTADGQWHQLRPNPVDASGQSECYEWSVDQNSTVVGAFESYLDGVCSLRLTYGDNNRVETEFVFADDLVTPSTTPTLLEPIYGGEVSPSAPIAWSPQPGPEVNDVFLTLDRMTNAAEIIEVHGLVDTNEYVPAELLDYGQTYMARIFFADSEEALNADGVSFTSSRYTADQDFVQTFGNDADLRVVLTSVNGFGPTVERNQQGQVNVDVLNRGGQVAAGEVTVTVYLSRFEDTLIDAVAIGSTVSNLNLGSDDIQQFAVDVTIPEVLDSDEYYVLAVVTTDDAIVEGNADNNTSNAAAETVTISEAFVDLAISVDSTEGFVSPMLWGDEAVVNVTVANEGNSRATGEMVLKLFVASSQDGSGSGTVIGAQTFDISLSAGQVGQFAVDATIPDGLADGEYYVFAGMYPPNSQYERNADNNQAPVFEEPVDIVQPIADLALSVDATSYAGRVLANEAGTVTMIVTNNGTIDARGTIRTRVYISTSAEWDGSAVQIGYVNTSIDLAPGESAEYAASVRIPANTATDAYYLIGKIDPTSYIPDRDAADNEAAWDIPLTIEAPQSDLSGEVVSVSYDGEVLPGAAGQMNLLVTNLGNTAINQSVYVTVYASTTEVLGDEAIQVARVATGITADADGGTSDETIALKLPADMAPGQYYLVAVLDSLERVSESNESNNEAVSAGTINVVAPVVDLVGEMTSVGFDGQVVAGATGNLVLQVTNNGNTAMPYKYVDLKVYLSESLDPAAGTLIKSVRSGMTLKAEGENAAAVTIPLTIPADTATGDFYLLVKIDETEAIDEASDANNLVASETTIAVAEQVIDLVGTVDDVTLAEDILAGARGTATVTVANNGNTKLASTYVRVNLYAAVGDAVDDTSILLGSQNKPVTLAAAGGEAAYSFAVTTPTDMDLGSYNLIAVVDADATVAEGDETNNEALAGQALNVVAPFKDVAIEVTDFNYVEPILPGDTGTVTLTLTNNGNVPAAGMATVTLYASADAVAGADVELLVVPIRVSLAAYGGTTTIRRTVTIPEAVFDADQMSFVATVETDEAIVESDLDNNIAITAGPEMDDPYRDLRGELTSATLKQIMVAGDRGTVRARIFNDGNIPYVGTLALSVYAQDAADAEADPILLAAHEQNVNLRRDGGYVSVSINVDVPGTLADETEYNLYLAIDPADAIEETDEANNEVALSEQPYLFVERFGTFEGHRNVAFALADGDVEAVFTLTGGGYGTAEVNPAGGYDIVLTGTTRSSRFTIAAGEGQTAQIRSLTVSGDMGTVTATTSDLVGSMTFGGALSTMVLHDVADQHVITIGESTTASNLQFNDVTDLTLTTASPISKLAVNRWLDGDGTADAVSAPYIQTLTSAGDFQANLILSGVGAPGNMTLGKVDIAGAVDDGNDADVDWDIQAGKVGTIGIDGLVDNFALSADALVRTTLGTANDATLTVTGDAGTVTADTWGDGAISAGSIRTLTTAGDFGASLLLSGKLNRATVGGNVIGGTWRPGEMGTMTIAGTTNGWTLDLGDGDLRSMTLSEAVDTSIIAGAIGVIKAANWTGGSVQGESIKTLQTTGNFSAGITLTGTAATTLGNVRVGGDMIYADLDANDGDDGVGIDIDPVGWDIAGGIGTVRVDGTVDNLYVQANALRSFTAGAVVGAWFGAEDTSMGAIGTISVGSWAEGGVRGESLRTLKVAGDLSAGIALNGTAATTLGSVTVGGNIADGIRGADDDGVGSRAYTTWDVAGGIGTIRVAGTIDDVRIYADAIRSITAGAVGYASMGTNEAPLGAIGTINIASWAQGEIVGESIRTLNVAGDFSAGITLSGTEATTLNNVRIGGNLMYGALDAGVGEIAPVDGWDIAGGIGTVRVDGTVDDLTINADALRSFTAGAVGNASMGSAETPLGAIGTINVDSWASGEVVAESIRTLKVANDFGATLTLDAGEAKAFNSARIDGSITGGDWNITGSLGTMRVAGGVSDWLLNLGTAALSSLQVGNAVNMSVIAASIGRVTADSWVGGTITTDSIGSIRTTGDFGASLTLADDGTRALGSVTAGTITGGTWNVGGSVGSVRADAWTDGTVSAAKIGSIRLTGGFAADLTVTGTDTLALGSLTTKGDVTAETVNVAGGIGTLSVNSWTGGTITAASIRTLMTYDDFGATLHLSNTDARALGAATIRGDLTGGVWTIAGGISSVRVTGQAQGASINASGLLRSMTASSYAGTQIMADSVGTLTSYGDMTGVAVTATQPVQDRKYAVSTVTVRGTLDASEIRSAGSIGTVTLGAMHNSSMFAGVDDGVVGLPTSSAVLGDLDADVLAAINRFVISGSRDLGDADLLVNSNIAAAKINNASVKQVAIDNNEDPFGFVAGHTLKLNWHDGTRWQIFGRSDWPADTDDFVVDILQADPA